MPAVVSIMSVRRTIRRLEPGPQDWDTIAAVMGNTPAAVQTEATLALAKLRYQCEKKGVTINELRNYLEVTNARELCFTALLLQRLGQL